MASTGSAVGGGGPTGRVRCCRWWSWRRWRSVWSGSATGCRGREPGLRRARSTVGTSPSGRTVGLLVVGVGRADVRRRAGRRSRGDRGRCWRAGGSAGAGDVLHGRPGDGAAPRTGAGGAARGLVVGSQGWSHPDMRGLSAEQVNAQLRRTAGAYREITAGGGWCSGDRRTGRRARRWFRPGRRRGCRWCCGRWTRRTTGARAGVGGRMRCCGSWMRRRRSGRRGRAAALGVTATVEAWLMMRAGAPVARARFGRGGRAADGQWPCESPGMTYRVSAVDPKKVAR